MSYFPKASEDKAASIATEIKKRKRNKSGLVSSLYNGHFLRPNYGFSDAIKSGRCGHFLHEFEYDADCFSQTGMSYLIAKHLGLEPKMYDAKDMQDLQIFETPDERTIEDHAFLTIMYKGKEYLVDPFMNAKGYIKKETSQWHIKDNSDININKIRRNFGHIHEISEQEYVQRLNENRKAENGKKVLSTTQTINIGHHRVAIQYDETNNNLTSNVIIGIDNHFINPEDDMGKNKHYVINIPIDKNGKLHINESEFESFSTFEKRWNVDEIEDKFNRFNIDYSLILEALNNLKIGAKHFNHTTYFKQLFNVKDHYKKLRDIGFNHIGEIIKDNGVDPEHHNEIMKQICDSYRIDANNQLEDNLIKRSTIYSAEISRQRMNNPEALLYSKVELEEFEQELLELLKERRESISKNSFNLIKAYAGINSTVEKEKDIATTLLNQDNRINRFQDKLVGTRKMIPNAYWASMDFALFGLNNPITEESVFSPTKEDYELRTKALAWDTLISVSTIKPQLELRGFRSGLENILGQ